jgi:hypothetical protein
MEPESEAQGRLNFKLRERTMPPSWAGRIPTSTFLIEAQRIVDLARQAGLTLRLVGGVAIRLRSVHLEALA